jgi:Anti-sigma factor NepR
MTAKIGSAEQSSDGQVGAGLTDRSEAEQEVSARNASTRHLYVVHSAEPSRSPSPMERSPPPASRPKKTRGMVDRSAQAQIGRMLRDGFSDIAQEPVPPRFVRLLEALEAKEKKP